MTRSSTSDATARLQEAEAKRELSRQLKQALKAPEGERSAEEAALLVANPEAVARQQSAMDRTAARKLQEEANAAEVEEDAAELQQKVVRLAELLRAAKHAVVYTGAGVSTSASIPDYRGPQGIWTLSKKGAHNASSAAKADMMGIAFVEAQPTPTHMGCAFAAPSLHPRCTLADSSLSLSLSLRHSELRWLLCRLAALTARGLVKSVVSQNVDGLHLRSGVPHTKLCELHGNVFREVCSACAKEYLRSFDVTEKSSYHRHATPRLCATRSCRAPLADTIVYFGERVNDTVLEEAKQQACHPPTKLARRNLM